MSNLYKTFLRLIPTPSLQIGEVLAVDDGVATIELPGGGIAQARGNATPGNKVFFRDNVIEGPAPDLPIEVIEI